MAKRYLSMALVICMMLMTFPFVASADANVIEVSTWAEFDAAFGQGYDPANPVTIVLKSDIEWGWRYGWIEGKYVNVITDGGDYTISNPEGMTDNNWMEFWGSNVINFGSADSGKITFVTGPNDADAEDNNKYAPRFFNVNRDTDVITFTNCEFTTNYTDNPGKLGAMYFGNGTTSFVNCKIYNTRRAMQIEGSAVVNLTNTGIIDNGNPALEDLTYELKGAGVVVNGGSAVLNTYGATFSGNVSKGAYSGGGALWVSNGTANLYADDNGNPTVIDGNKSYSTGAGIWVTNSASTVNIFDAEITNNVSSGAGGGILAEGSSNTYIYNAKINNNEVTGDWVRGGAIKVQGNANVYLYGGEVCGNTGKEKGPAIEVNGANLVIGNEEGGPVISGNHGQLGGGLYIDGSSTVNFVNGSFENNYTSSNGGAIYLDSSSVLNMTGGTITGNYTTGSWNKRGSAIYAGGNSTVSITGGTITGNYHEKPAGQDNIGGVHFAGKAMTIGGDAVISDYLTMASGKIVTIDPALANEDAITVWQNNFVLDTVLFDGLVASSFDKINCSDEAYEISSSGTIIEAGSDPDATPAPTVVPTATPIPTATPEPTPEPTPVPTFDPSTGVELWANMGNQYYYEEAGVTELSAVNASKYFNDGDQARIALSAANLTDESTDNDVDGYIDFIPNSESVTNKTSDMYLYVFGEYGYTIFTATVTYDGGKTDTVTVLDYVDGKYVDANGDAVPVGDNAMGKQVPVYVGNYPNVESVRITASAAGKTSTAIWKMQFLTEDIEVVEPTATPEPTEAPVVYVAEVGGVEYETLPEAVEAATAGATVTLLCDAHGDGVIIPSGKNITIDLGGYEYIIDGTLVGSKGTETNGLQLLKDSTNVIKNGTISSTKAKIIIQNYSNLTLENVTVDGTAIEDDGKNNSYPYMVSINSGDVKFIGNTNIVAPAYGTAFDSCKFGSYEIPTVTIETTGTITGAIEATGGNIAISSGTYTVALDEAWCAEGFAPVDNGDGTYGVEVISISITDDDCVVTTGVSSAVVVLASYKTESNGKQVLIDIKCVNVTENANFTIESSGLDTTNATSVTAMLIEGVTNIRPICANAVK